jgi:hypothetical protein
MTEFSILHWVIVFFILFAMTGIPFFMAYRYGKRSGDKEGYARGYREGRQGSGQSIGSHGEESASIR